MGNYKDALVYDNSPLDFLAVMSDNHYYWNLYRSRRIICCVGQGRWEDELLDYTRKLDALLTSKHVEHWCDYWGYDVDHDWLWWRKQVYYFMNHIVYSDLERTIL